MVTFSCDECADVIKKPKLDQHRSRCPNASFTCIDCSTTFHGVEYQAHTSCISEAEKYHKGVGKKDLGLDKLKRNLEKSNLKLNSAQKQKSDKTQKTPDKQNLNQKSNKPQKTLENQNLIQPQKKPDKLPKTPEKLPKTSEKPQKTLEKPQKTLETPQKTLEKQPKNLEKQNSIQKSDKPQKTPEKSKDAQVNEPTNNSGNSNKKKKKNKNKSGEVDIAMLDRIVDDVLKTPNKEPKSLQDNNGTPSENSNKRKGIDSLITYPHSQELDETPSKKKKIHDAKGKAPKGHKAIGNGNVGHDNEVVQIDFKTRIPTVVKKVFESGEFTELSLENLEHMAIDELKSDPHNIANSDELLEQFKKNVLFAKNKKGMIFLK